MSITTKILGALTALSLSATLFPAAARADDPIDDGDLPVCYPVERCIEICPDDTSGDGCFDLCGVFYVCPGFGGGGGGGGGDDDCDDLFPKDNPACENFPPEF